MGNPAGFAGLTLQVEAQGEALLLLCPALQGAYVPLQLAADVNVSVFIDIEEADLTFAQPVEADHRGQQPKLLTTVLEHLRK